MKDEIEEKNVFKRLNKIKVLDLLETKNKFNYLSWSVALKLLLCEDCNASWEFHPHERFGNTMMVWCSVTAFGITRKMQLPVLNFANKPIINPTAMDINTAMQRCLVKCIAVHGIGLDVYHNEDIRDLMQSQEVEKTQVFEPEIKDLPKLGQKEKKTEQKGQLIIINTPIPDEVEKQVEWFEEVKGIVRKAITMDQTVESLNATWNNFMGSSNSPTEFHKEMSSTIRNGFTEILQIFKDRKEILKQQIKEMEDKNGK